MREIEKEIGEKLDEIEKTEGVRILHAVESGSRAWGFASPDSDYDVRFVYVRAAEDYLRIDEPGDVIEWQLDEVLDINGWDLKKALRQFARGNATLYEWSGSPIVYRTTRDWEKIREALRPLLAAQYIEKYHAAPPVLFDHLLELDMPLELKAAIDELLEIKKKTTEGEEKPHMPVIRSFIETETARQKGIADGLLDDRNQDWSALNGVFREVISQGKL